MTIVLTRDLYEGNFIVPAGVTIEGNGAVIVGERCAPVLRVEGGSAEAPTRLVNVRVENDGIGVVAQGDGELELEEVEIEVSSYGGVLIDGLDRVSFDRVSVIGALTEENASALGSINGFSLDAAAYPVVGALLWRVADVQMTDVDLKGFGGYGAVFHRSAGSWRGGGVSRWIGAAILVEESDVSLDGVRVQGSIRVPNLRLTSSGVAVTRGGKLVSRGLEVADVAGYGLIMDDAQSAHDDLLIRDNERGGVWVQNAFPEDAPALTIHGDSWIVGNRGLGLYMRDFEGLDFDGLTIADTTPRDQLVGELGVVTMGDGVQMVGASGRLWMSDTRLVGHPRVGWVFDGTHAGLAAPVSFEGALAIDVGDLDAPEQAYGFIMQNMEGSFPDALIERGGFAEQDAQAREDGVTLQVLMGSGDGPEQEPRVQLEDIFPPDEEVRFACP